MWASIHCLFSCRLRFSWLFFGWVIFSCTVDTTLQIKVHTIKVMVFLVVMYRWELDHKEDWALKNWCFWTVVLRRLLRVPWTARRSKHSILKEITPEYSLEGLMLKLKVQYFGHLMWRDDSLEKTLMLGKTEGKRRREQQKMRWLDGITDSTDMNLSKLGDSGGQSSLACCSPWGCKQSDPA